MTLGNSETTGAGAGADTDAGADSTSSTGFFARGARFLGAGASAAASTGASAAAVTATAASSATTFLARLRTGLATVASALSPATGKAACCSSLELDGFIILNLGYSDRARHQLHGRRQGR